jgi:hypothetical protein
MPDYSRSVRSDGNPNQGDENREASRLGKQRTPDDIPKQDVKKGGGIVPGNVDPTDFQPSTTWTRGVYRLGLRGRPTIVHDNGHLVLGRRPPGAGDYVALAKWRAMLAAGEALRSDLSDALAAYRHFLEGRGQPRTFSYERYVMTDRSGQITLRNAIIEFQEAALGLWDLAKRPSALQISGPAIPCGASPVKHSYLASHFPYPATENWQKAIGSHYIWLSGETTVTENQHLSPPLGFRATMTLHAEDRYNFNVGDEDIATGIPDSDNGRFEVTGLGQQYDNFSTLTRILEWRGHDVGVALAAKPNTVRLRQPADNRRLRNRL